MLRILLGLLMLTAAFSFGLGLTLPLMRFEKLYFFEETPSLLSVISGLHGEGEILLAVLILAFSVVLPAIKLALLFIAGFGGRGRRQMLLLSTVSRWSMMDVMLVALVVFGAKTSGLASAVTLPGLWFYASATFSSVIAAFLVKRGVR